jgi:ATP-dependent DNA ligase
MHPRGFIEPCLPTVSRTVPTGPQWAYEIKHDGFRFVCHRDGERVRVFSRTGHEWSAQLPAIATALRALPVRSAIIDGEGVICGPDGLTDFDRMRAVFGRKGSPDVFLYAFDVLELDGRDLRGERWEARRELLTQLLDRCQDGVRLSEHIAEADGEVIFRQADVELGHQQLENLVHTRQRVHDARHRFVVHRVGRKVTLDSIEFMEHLLEPKLIGLVDDDKEQLVMHRRSVLRTLG